MKFTNAMLCIVAALAAPAAIAVESAAVPTPSEALATIKTMDLPSGVSVTGSVEPLKEPPMKKEGEGDAKHEQWGWGGIGGWGGCGPYRFGFGLGGLYGWAYPLNYWNTWGASLYGGGCGFGFPYGNFYYC